MICRYFLQLLPCSPLHHPPPIPINSSQSYPISCSSFYVLLLHPNQLQSSVSYLLLPLAIPPPMPPPTPINSSQACPISCYLLLFLSHPLQVINYCLQFSSPRTFSYSPHSFPFRFPAKWLSNHTISRCSIRVSYLATPSLFLTSWFAGMCLFLFISCKNISNLKRHLLYTNTYKKIYSTCLWFENWRYLNCYKILPCTDKAHSVQHFFKIWNLLFHRNVNLRTCVKCHSYLNETLPVHQTESPVDSDATYIRILLQSVK